MTTLIRHATFETNSSSCHSLSIAAPALIYDNLYPNEAGEIVITPGDFGWYQDHFTDAESKLSYVLIYIRDWTSGTKQTAFTDILNDVVLGHTGADSVRLSDPTDGYIDHQSVESNDLDYLFNNDGAQLKEFIFNPGSELTTDNDNH